ncbi:MAG: hypothetical protein KGM99_00610 [Burkholderiales bacterium]|nr:hypothetical protein [Burkholderiales bacterium]
MTSPFSGTEIPGMNAMNDTLSFVKSLWGSMQVPGMVAPPMSVDELDKKIKDLKTVESWLNVNMNMLRGTIQALEVQRATVAALQSLGESFAQHAQQTATMSEQAASAFRQATDGAASATASAAGGAAASGRDWPMPPAEAAPEPEPALSDAAEDAPANKADAQASAATSAADNSTPFANPAAWWNLLQDQFRQAVSKAMEGEVMPDAMPAEAATARKTPAAKSTKAASKPVKASTAAGARSKPKTPAPKKAAAPASKVSNPKAAASKPKTTTRSKT